MNVNKEVKQIIIIRKDLNMRKGKCCSQAAHASFKVFLDLSSTYHDDNIVNFFKYNSNSVWDKWLNGGFTKVVVSCNSEDELIELYEKAKEANIPTALIIDSGATEFNGIPTKTCVAIGPDYNENINPITSHLKLL